MVLWKVFLALSPVVANCVLDDSLYTRNFLHLPVVPSLYRYFPLMYRTHSHQTDRDLPKIRRSPTHTLLIVLARFRQITNYQLSRPSLPGLLSYNDSLLIIFVLPLKIFVLRNSYERWYIDGHLKDSVRCTMLSVSELPEDLYCMHKLLKRGATLLVVYQRRHVKLTIIKIETCRNSHRKYIISSRPRANPPIILSLDVCKYLMASPHRAIK